MLKNIEDKNNTQPLFEDKKRVLDDINEKFLKKREEVSNHPNILLAGNSGSGKSSLVNAIFGNPNLAIIGIGNSVTQGTKQIEGDVEDAVETIKTKRPFVIHDVRGLEPGSGETEKFIENTAAYLKSHTIHVVWYIVSTGQQRFLDTDLELIEKVYAKYPVIIVLNKIDQIPQSETKRFEASIREILDERKCKNVKAIVKTCANIFDPDRRTCYIVNECTGCGGKRILIDIYDKEAICQNRECGLTVDVQINDGLSTLVQITSKLLPEIASRIFISEQQVDLNLKDLLAREIILESFNRARSEMDQLFQGDRVDFIVKLGSIFGMDETGKCFSHKIFEWFQDQVIGREPSSKFYFKIMDYLEKIFFSMTNVQMVVACEGMFWYFFFRKYYMKHLNMVMEMDTEDNYMIYDKYFKLLSQTGIDATLDQYFTDLQRIEKVEDD